MTEHTSPLPDVSIIIACYNLAEYVAQAIESALSQTYPSVEVIVIDDGSTDSSPQVIASYAESYPERVRVITQANQGFAKTLDVGVREAKGHYVLPLGADDYFHPQAVESMYRYAQAHPEYAVVYPDHCRIRATGELGTISPVSARALKVEGDILPSVLGAGIVVTSALILKEAIQRVGGYFLRSVWHPEYRHEDYFLYLRMLLVGYQFGYVSQSLLFYRDTPNSRGKDVKWVRLGKHTALQYAYRHYPHRMVDAANELLSLGLASRQEAQELREEMDARVSAAREQLAQEFEAQLQDVVARHADEVHTQEAISTQKDAELAGLLFAVSELQSELESRQAKLERANVLANQTMAELEHANAELASLTARMQAELQSREHESDHYRQLETDHLVALSQLETRVRELRSDLDSTHTEIHKMRSTRGWRAIEKWWATRDSVRFRIHRAQQLAVMSRSILIHAGPVAFANRLIRWLRGERRYYHPNAKVNLSSNVPTTTSSVPALGDAYHATNVGPARSFRVAYIVSGDEHLLSKRYRVHNVRERLRLHEVTLSEVLDIDVAQHHDFILGFDIVVFSRVVPLPGFDELIAALDSAGIPVVFEIDDYVFDTQIVDHIDAVRHFPKPDLELYIDGLMRYRTMLMRCKYFIGSTQYLADHASELGRKSYVVRNGLNDRQLELAIAALQKGKPTSDWVRIGYLSGTSTHQADFNVAVPAITRIMDEFPNVRLVIRGFLEIQGALLRHADRIDSLPFVAWEELVAATAELDINLAPLEHNPFTEAKSALKYFEAGLVEVPTIASPTDDFKYAIHHGENGLLAATEQEWHECLRALVSDADLRRQIGKSARHDVLQRFTTSAQGWDTLRVFSSILFDKINASLFICWITTRPARGSGGHRMVLRMAHMLATFGHRVHVYIIDDGYFGSEKELRTYIREDFGCEAPQYILGVQDIPPCDALIATTWNSAFAAREHSSKARQTFYFVQDYEPHFYAVGMDHIQAEQTYTFGFHHITVGPWLTDLLRKEFTAKADYVQFPLDHSIYRPANDASPLQAPRVVFFAKPDVPRRCYLLGLEMLHDLHRKMPEAEIILFGSNEIDSHRIPFEHTNLGVIKDLQDLRALYCSATVGIAFSTTNPSVVPYEMMACGCPVVDLDYGGNALNYGSPENVTLAPPDSEQLSDAIVSLIRNPELREKRIKNGLEYVSRFPSIEQAARTVEKLIREGIHAALFQPDHHASV